MNTITSVKPYVGLKNTPQTTSPQTPQQPAFKGQLGKEVVKKVMNKEAVTVASVLAMMAGLIGLNKEKVSDVIEEFLNKIRGLQSEKDDLSKQLEQTRADASKKVEDAREIAADNERRLIESYNTALKDKDNIINQKDAKIAELENYQALVYLRPVSELDIVTTEDFVATLKEAQEAMPKVEKSMIEFLFNGTGQEEIMTQLERNNKILKAKQDGITKIPEMRKTYESSKTYIGLDPYMVFQYMMKRALLHDEKACEQLNYPPIMRQVLMNADALSQPLKMKKDNYYRKTNAAILTELPNSCFKLKENKNKLIKEGWKFESRETHTNGRPYYRFSKDDTKMDIYIDDLAAGNRCYGRTINADGKISQCLAGKEYWE